MGSAAYEQIVTVDFETYFSKEYSLRLKQYNTSGYIRDAQFKAQCVAIKVGTDPVVWVPDRLVDQALRTVDWSRSALLAHHVCFDGYILSHHYGITPAYYLDTLSMGRALHSNGVSASLDSLARLYKLGNKLPDILGQTKGVRDIPDELMNQLGQYCAVDTELCHELFCKMLPHFSQNELDLINLTARMFCEPVLRLDVPRLEAELERVKLETQQKISAAKVPKTVLSSNKQFAQLLADRGVKVPMKKSPTTGKQTYAFAKNDIGFQALLHHGDEGVRRIVAARMAAKSTIGETRCARLLSESKAPGNLLPVYLNYYGAHTGRWSGGNKINLQNLGRGSELRRSIIAPPGHSVVVADSSQIEARMLGWLANDQDLLNQFRLKEDVYKHMAAAIYSKPYNQITGTERFVGKVAVLGLGYGMGAEKFRNTLLVGAMGPPVEITMATAYNVVQTYRAARRAIKQLWTLYQETLLNMAAWDPNGEPYDLGPLCIVPEENKVLLPNDLYLQYPGLQIDEKTSNLVYFDYATAVKIRLRGDIGEDKGKKMYGGLFTENVTQALARIVVGEQMLAVEKYFMDLRERAKQGDIYRVATMTHDEIVSVVPTEMAQTVLDEKIRLMSIAPQWCKGVPLAAEGGFDVNYSK